jgi:hypothetical protein
MTRETFYGSKNKTAFDGLLAISIWAVRDSPRPIRLVAITPLAGYVVTGFNSAGEPDLSKAKSARGF